MKKAIRILSAVLLAAMLLIVAAPAGADEYPATNINGIVPWGAGGGTDTVCRLAVPAAQQFLGKSIIMVNKGGASGSIGHQFVYDRKADGYTLLFNSEIPTLYPVLGLSPLSYDEFEPITLFANVASVVIVHKDSPYNTLDDLLNDAKKRPGKITMGISGVGGLPYVSSLILKKSSGAEFAPVNYNGDAPQITALMGKQIDTTVVATGSAIQYIKNGDFKGLAIIGNKTIPAISNVPALGDLKPETRDMLKTTGPFFGVYVKKGTPEPIIRKLTEAFQKGFNDPKLQEFIKTSGYIALGQTGNAAREYIKMWQSQTAWLIYDAGGAKESPAKFNIAKPSK